MNKQDREQLKEFNKKLDEIEELMNNKYRKIKTHFKNQYTEAVRQSGYTLAGIIASYATLFTVLYLDPKKSVNEWIVIVVILFYMVIVFIMIIREIIIGKKNLKEWFGKEESN